MLDPDMDLRPTSAKRQRRWHVVRPGIRLLLLVLVATACAAGAPVHAALRDYVFERITVEPDLAQNSVNAVVQDRTGFLWVATQGGLHRYDGHRYTRFRHDPADPASLPDSYVSAIAEDATGRLWVGTQSGGLAWLDRTRGRFVREGMGLDEDSLRRGPIGALLADDQHGLWVGSYRGVSLFGAGGRRDLLVFDDDGSAAEVRALARGDGDSAWAATNRGLWRIDAARGNVERVPVGGARSFSAVLAMADGTIWVGAADGVHVRAADGRWQRRWPDARAREANTEVLALARAPDGRVWAGVFGGGIVVLDPAGGDPQRLRSEPRVTGSLPEDMVRTLTVDRSGLMWIGGYVTGLTRVDPAGARFPLVRDQDPSRPAIETNNVRALHQDRDGAVWVGTEGDGLKRYDLVADRFEYHSDVLRAALPSARQAQVLWVFDIVEDATGAMWLGTNHGVLVLAPDRSSARWIAVRAPGTADDESAMVRVIVADPDGRWWFGTMAHGLVRHAPASGSFEWFPERAGDPASLWHHTVLAMTRDSQGRLWIGTFDGLNLIEPGASAPRRLPRAGAEPGLPAGDMIRAIVETRDGSIWVASHDGLSKLEALDADGARFGRVSVADGLPDATVYGLREDALGRLWLATNGGIIRYEPDRGRFRAYSLADGLQALEYNGGADLTLADGRLVFGGPAGFNVFDPLRIVDSDYAPAVVLTQVWRQDRWQPVLDPAAPLELDSADGARAIGFEFVALDFGAPRQTRFAYRLDGVEDAWVDLGTQRQLTFTRLPAGDYRLRVRATNRDQVPSPAELTLDFRVAGPWWASRWVQLLAVLAALGLVVAIIEAQRRRSGRLRAHTRELREREERLRVAIWGSGDEFWDWDMRKGVLFRIGADNLLGARESETRISGDDWRHKAVHPDDLPSVERILAEHVAGQRDAFESEHRVKNATGEYIWVRSRGKIVERDEDGQALRVAGTARDITATRAADRERRIAAEVIRSMAEAVTVTDLEFRFHSVNPAFTRITGYTEAEALGRDSSILDCDQHGPAFHRELRETLVRTGHWSGEIWQRRKDGEEFLCWLELSEVTDADGVRTHWVGVLADITDRKRAEQELRYLANYDTLTGLPNRTLLGERLSHALIRARRADTKVAVLFLDLDRFKHVNDSMGHAAGDRLLKAAAARILATVRDADTVARLGGDEFTVVVEDLDSAAQAENIAKKLLDAFVTPLDIDGRTEVVISPSIGISIYPDHGQVPTDLLKFADTAMYQAKERGRNTFQTYTEQMDARARSRATMVSHLHKAVERGEMSLVYQPKLSLTDQRITGVEALLRWNNPELGRVSPAEFIPLAEETGLIVPIGEWVLREACMQVQRWIRAGIPGITMAVNVSMLQLLRGELYSVLRQLLEDFRIPPWRIALELTETMVMANAEQSISTLTQLKSLGVNLAIDDFGTGYSSLAYLKRLPIDTLKIDKEFVGDITTDPDDEAITSTIITMAHSLGLDVVAEGVETAEQLDYLREQGCDEAQGNFISLPIDPDRLFKMLVERKAAAEGRGSVVEFPPGKRVDR
jgi:diguanylate cyclase (GGDEF)-like protein/PAS domain S-box-containing protein